MASSGSWVSERIERAAKIGILTDVVGAEDVLGLRVFQVEVFLPYPNQTDAALETSRNTYILKYSERTHRTSGLSVIVQSYRSVAPSTLDKNSFSRRTILCDRINGLRRLSRGRSMSTASQVALNAFEPSPIRETVSAQPQVDSTVAHPGPTMGGTFKSNWASFFRSPFDPFGHRSNVEVFCEVE